MQIPLQKEDFAVLEAPEKATFRRDQRRDFVKNAHDFRFLKAPSPATTPTILYVRST